MVDIARAMLVFRDELRSEKTAGPWQALGRNIGSFGGVGAAAGAGLGALTGAYQGYEGTKEQLPDGSTGHHLLGALAGGVAGATKGGLLGGALGGGAGALATKVAPQAASRMAGRIAETPYLGAAGRFGQRQVHAATGWKPDGGVGSIGVNGPEGMTSLPDIAKGLRHDPVGTVQKGFSHQWNSSDRLGKAMMALPAAGMAYSALGPEDPEKGRGERFGEQAAALLGGALTSRLPVIPQIAASMASGALGSSIGHVVDRSVGSKSPNPVGRQHTAYNPHIRDQDDTTSQATPTERYMTPNAMGRAPEGIA